MPIVVDPKTALVVVDMQKGILAMAPDEVVQPLIGQVNRLVGAFHDAGLPVVWVVATGLPAGRVTRPINEPTELPANFTQLRQEMAARDSDHRVAKQRTWSAFPNTDLADHLRANDVTCVVCCGIATGAGVESSARSAYDEGFSVVVAADACFDGNQERHTNSLRQALPALAVVGSVDDVIAAVATR